MGPSRSVTGDNLKGKTLGLVPSVLFIMLSILFIAVVLTATTIMLRP